MKLNNWNIIGHQKIITFLKNSYESNNLSHAYLFSGPGSIGKTTTAKYFAKTILCKKNEKPCNSCFSCKSFDKNTHPDFHFLPSNTHKIKKFKEILNITNITPHCSTHKIIIIKNIELSTKEAANSVLKRLEEPQGNTIYILTCSNPKKTLNTIKSRCLPLSFCTPPFKLLNQYFTDKIPSSYIDEVIKLSHHKPGAIIDLVKNNNIYSFIKIPVTIKKLLESNLSTKFNYIKKLSNNKQKTNQFLIHLKNYFYQNLHLSSKYLSNLKLVNEASSNLKRNASVKLTLEYLILNITS